MQDVVNHDTIVESPKVSYYHNKKFSSNYQTCPDHANTLESLETEKLTTETYTATPTTLEFVKQSPLVKIEEFFNGNDASFEMKPQQFGHRRIETMHLQFSKMTSSVQKDLKKLIGSSQNPRECKKTNNMHRPTQSVSFTTEISLNAGALKNVIKPALTIIPQKQIIDEIVPDSNNGLKTHRTGGNINDNSVLQERQAIEDTDRAYFQPEPEGFEHHSLSFIRNTAKKEKAVIKSLLRDEMTEDAAFRLKGSI